MTNVEMLCFGMKHIAENHGFEAHTNYEEDGSLLIWGGCNVPTLADVLFLCEDMGIDVNCIEADSWGIVVFPTQGWWNKKANKEYVKGFEYWRKAI